MALRDRGHNVTHTYGVVPEFEGYYVPDRAVISYTVGDDKEATVVPLFPSDIVIDSCYQGVAM